MIKLLTLFLSLSVANAQTISYMLPDDKALFEYSLAAHLKKANATIVILTPALHYGALHTQLIHTIGKGIKLTLITQNLTHDPLELIASRGVELYEYHARPLADTLILIDNTLVCHLSGALEDEDLVHKTQNVLCSDEPELLQTIQLNIHKTLARSKPYLK